MTTRAAENFLRTGMLLMIVQPLHHIKQICNKNATRRWHLSFSSSWITQL
jgi:hypothetical protein